MSKSRVTMLDVVQVAGDAVEWAREHEEEVSDTMKAIWRDRPPDQHMVLLAAALRLVAQERKEAGNG